MSAAPLEQVRILAHPLRLKLFELFAEAPRTTKQAAEVLELPPTRLYHHVAALERVGLVRLRETRRNRGTVEKHYEATRRGFALDPGRGAGSRRLAHTAAGAMALRVVDRAREELAAALDAGSDPLAARVILHVAPEEVRALIAALIERLRRHKRSRNRASLTIVLAPEAG